LLIAAFGGAIFLAGSRRLLLFNDLMRRGGDMWRDQKLILLFLGRPIWQSFRWGRRILIVRNLGHPMRIVFTYHDDMPTGSGGKFEEFVSSLDA